MSVFDFDKLDNATKSSHTLNSMLWQHKTNIKNFINIDPRVSEFCSLTAQENALSSEFENVYNKFEKTFIPWFEKTVSEAKNVENNNQKLAGEISIMPYTLVNNFNSSNNDDKYTFFSEQKSLISIELKKLGFNADEINDIINGKTKVNKVKLDELCYNLENIYKNNHSIRKLILEKYGFDIFNDDGTVIRDLAAIVIIMDGKFDDDDYDINNLIASLTTIVIEKNNENTDKTKIVDSIDEIINDGKNMVDLSADDNNTKNIVEHFGSSFSEINYSPDRNKEIQEEINEVLSNDALGGEKSYITDDIKKTSGSILRGKIARANNVNNNDVQSSSGVNSALVGLATAVAVGGAGMLAINKKKNDKKNNSNDSFNDDDIDYDDNNYSDNTNENDDNDYDDNYTANLNNDNDGNYYDDDNYIDNLNNDNSDENN